uniref:Uncharacterized protein n=1 Tax=Arundo donax TaxID=35708 RepID=A0A0A9AZ17_ARUDO
MLNFNGLTFIHSLLNSYCFQALLRLTYHSVPSSFVLQENLTLISLICLRDSRTSIWREPILWKVSAIIIDLFIFSLGRIDDIINFWCRIISSILVCRNYNWYARRTLPNRIISVLSDQFSIVSFFEGR